MMDFLRAINEFWPVVIGLAGISIWGVKLWNERIHDITNAQTRLSRLEAKMEDTHEADLKLSASLAKINLTLTSLLIEQKNVIKAVKALLRSSDIGDIL